MSAAGPSAVRVARILAGDARAGAALMRDIDDGAVSAAEDLAALYPHAGQAFVVGITGPPGAGKSTVVDALIPLLRARGDQVGVVAVDPSSPFSGGAILGDRIRMQRHAPDDGTFIRSLATRGELGGLSRATAGVVNVLAAMGKGVILIETVGVGQDEIDVAALADTVVVIAVPGMGDDVQTLKAGILEVADVLAVNKADRDGAQLTARDLEAMLALRAEVARSAGAAVAPPPVEVILMSAGRGDGVDELLAAVDRHRHRQIATGGFAARRLRRADAELRAALGHRLRVALDQRLAAIGGLSALLADVAARRVDPYSVADALLR